jgi:hypothetical protein
MTTLEHGSKLAWPCHVACWLPTKQKEKLNTGLAASKNAAATGNWLTSVSKNGEIITIEVLRDAPPLLKIFCEGGRLLAASPLVSSQFSFALVKEVLLVASLIDPAGGSAYTFACRFMSHQHAVECAAMMKAAISTALAKTRPRLPAAAPLAKNHSPLPFSSSQQQRAEALLLETVVGGDMESVGAGWWPDFRFLVEEIDKKWSGAKYNYLR